MKYSREAYHEASHAVIAYYSGFKVTEATITPNTIKGYIGRVKMLGITPRDYDRLNTNKKVAYARGFVHTKLAGCIIELDIYGECNPEYVNNDMNESKKWILAIVELVGTDEMTVFNKLSEETKMLVNKYKKDIVYIAQLLTEYKIIKNIRKSITGKWLYDI